MFYESEVETILWTYVYIFKKDKKQFKDKTYKLYYVSRPTTSKLLSYFISY